MMEHHWDAKFWKTIVDSMLTGVYITDKSYKFLYVNDIFSWATGYSKEELMEMTILDTVHPEDLERAKKAAKRVENGETLIEEFRYVTKDGKVRWVLGLYRPFVYGGKGYAFGNYIDITKQKMLEEKLKESEEFYRMLVDRSFAGIYIVQDGKFVFANKSVARGAGFSSVEELMKTDPFEIVHPADRELVRKRYMEREAGIRDSEMYTWRIVRKGELRWVAGRSTRIEYRGKPAVYTTTLDVTELHNLTEELRRRNEYYNLLSKILRHDVLNDLAVVRAALEIRDEALFERALKRLDSALEKIKETKALEEALGVLKLINVAEIAREVVEKFKDEASFSLKLEDVYVEANEAIKSAIENLIRNAIQHGCVSPLEIEVTVAAIGDECVVRIADNGVGIADELKDRIFESGFSRKGGGLGLFLVKKIVEMFRGSIRVYDNVPRGAVFEIRLPRH